MSAHHARPLATAVAGLCALAVAMGIGRFAFTPLLPMMLHDGVITLPVASWLATANYIGYWLGAMACALPVASTTLAASATYLLLNRIPFSQARQMLNRVNGRPCRRPMRQRIVYFVPETAPGLPVSPSPEG